MRIDSDESSREGDLEGWQTLGLRRHNLRVGRPDRALRCLHHRALREVARRLRRNSGYAHDVEIGLIWLAYQNTQSCHRAFAVAARSVERKFGAVARGAELQYVICDHASAFFERLNRSDIARHPLEADQQSLLRTARAQQIE